MIYFVFAMKSEAEIFINEYGLKRKNSVFSEYSDEDRKVIISGTGPLNCSIATTYLLTQNNRGKNDIIFNIGVMGADDENIPGEIYLPNKISNSWNKKSYYPEIRMKNNFTETEITTVMNSEDSYKYKYSDMESYAFFKTALNFFDIENISVIKVKSDNISDHKKIISEDIRNVMKNSFNSINSYTESYRNFLMSYGKDISDIESIAENSPFTFTQKQILKNALKYYMYKNNEIPDIVKNINEKAKSASERKKILNEIIRYIYE